MSDSLPTIWPAEPHTRAKHQILKSYLDAWLPILDGNLHRRGTGGRLLLVDGFAGPGIYEAGEPGSPVLALRAVMEHSATFHCQVEFLFIEEDKDRFCSLDAVIAKHRTDVRAQGRVSDIKLVNRECEPFLSEWLGSRDTHREQLGPAFFFLDQFGYSDISMTLVRRIMAHSMCEVLIYLNWTRMNQFLSDQAKWPAISKAFGGDEWKQVLQLAGSSERVRFMHDTYLKALRQKARTQYVWPFSMCDQSGKLIHWLFFGTNSLSGLEQMKRAMLRVDNTAQFCFSDRDDPCQRALFADASDDQLAEELHTRLRGKTLMTEEVREFVLTQTRGVTFKTALKVLEKSGRLRVLDALPSRRAGTYADTRVRVFFLDSTP